MLDVKRIRQDPDGVRVALGRRLDPSLEGQVERVLELDVRRRELLVETEGLKAGRNTASEEVARRKKAKEPADDLLADLKVSGDRVKALDALLREVDAEIDGLVITLPNLPHP
ncbi:MAG: serine--tRNA ligase, partial [Gemmatimonadota bacterium]